MQCSQCGRVFPVVASRVERTQYCSKKCKNIAGQDRIETKCAYPECGRTFVHKKSKPRKYCCPECFYDDRTIPIKPLGLTDLEKSEVEALIIQYDLLVKKIANRLYTYLTPTTMDIEDFVQEGYLGLLQAYQHNDPEDDHTFGSFAKTYIYMEILAAWRKKDHGIRLPESLFRHDKKVTEQKERYKTMVFRHCSLEALKGWYPNANYSPVEQEVMRAEQIQELYQSLLKLPSLQRSLIAEHYGLSGEEVAQRQLCYRYNIPVVTMHRYIHKGLNKLKQTISSRTD